MPRIGGGQIGTTPTTALTIPPGRHPQRRAPTYIQNFQTGHGWATGGAGAAVTSNPNDTAAFIRGTQSFLLQTAGNGVQAQIRRTALTAMDLTGKAIRLLLKVDDVTHLSRIDLLAGNTNFANLYRWTLHTHSAVNPNYVQSGEWVTLTASWADILVGSGTYTINANGTPVSKTGFTDFRVDAYDDAAGIVNLHLQAFEVIPDTTTTFPTGIVSVTFDDSWHSVYDYARPALDGYGWRGTLYNIADTIGTDGAHLTLPELKNLQAASGWEIGGHAHTSAAHTASYTGMTAAQVDIDMRNMRAWLLANGFDSESIAYPKGQFATTLDGAPVEEIAARYWGSARAIVGEAKETFPPAMPGRLRCMTGINDGTGLGGTTVAAMTAAGGPLDRTALSGGWLILALHKLQTGAPTASDQLTSAGFGTLLAGVSSRGMTVLPVTDVLRYYT